MEEEIIGKEIPTDVVTTDHEHFDGLIDNIGNCIKKFYNDNEELNEEVVEIDMAIGKCPYCQDWHSTIRLNPRQQESDEVVQIKLDGDSPEEIIEKGMEALEAHATIPELEEYVEQFIFTFGRGEESPWEGKVFMKIKEQQEWDGSDEDEWEDPEGEEYEEDGVDESNEKIPWLNPNLK
jgi:hypothetical protein